MPKGVCIHCRTHRLNLVIVDVCQVVNYIEEFYSIMSSIYSFFTCFGVADEHFLDVQQKLNLGKYILFLLLLTLHEDTFYFRNNKVNIMV